MRTSGGKPWTTFGGAVGVVMALLSTSCGIVSNDANGGRDRRIQVVTVWTGYELELFEQIVKGYEDFRDVDVELVSPGDDLDSFIRARHQAGDPPDVALIPQPALIQEYASEGLLRPLDGFKNRYAEFWQNLSTLDGTFYGAWVKMTNKSLLWCIPDSEAVIGANHDCDKLETRRRSRWNQFGHAVAYLAKQGPPAPLALGATDGWPLTDWFENLLAAYDIAGIAGRPATSDCSGRHNDWDDANEPRVAGGLYSSLSNGEARWDRRPVEQALCALAAIWSPKGTFPDPGAHRALLTQFDESVIQVAHTEQATLVLGGDFASTIAGRVGGEEDQSEDLPLTFFTFPSPTERQPLIAAGDAAVVFRDSEHGEDPGTHSLDVGVDFVRWLTESGDWNDMDAHHGPLRDALSSLGYISPVREIYDSNFCERDAADTCTVAWFVGYCTDQILERGPCLPGDQPGRVNPRFDLSDQLPSVCRGRLETALQDFLIDVSTGRNHWLAAQTVMGTMQETVEEGLCQPT